MLIFNIFLLLPLISVLFYSLNLYSGIEISKDWFLVVSIAFTFCLFAVYVLFKKQFKISFSIFDLLFTAFLLFLTIRGASVFAMAIPVLFLIYYFLLTAVYQNIKKPHIFHLVFFFTILILAVIESVIGILQNYSVDLTGLSYFYKISGTFGAPTLFIALITPAIPIALSVYYLKDKASYKNFALTALALIILVLPLTHNRASWLAAVMGTAVFFILKNYELIKTWINNNLLKKIGLFIAPVVVLLTIGTALYLIRPASANSRLLIWRISYNMCKDKPVTGIGFGNFANKYMDYQAQFFKDESHMEKYSMITGNVNHAHNEYIQLSVETGIIGLALFLAILFYIFYHSLSLLFSHGLNKEESLFLIGALSAITSILVIAFFGFYFYFPYLTVFFIVYLALISHILGKNKIKRHTFLINKPLRILLAFISIFLLVLTSKNAYAEISSREIWQKALTLALYKQPQIAINKYKSIYSLQKDNGEYLYMLGATYISMDSVKKGLALLEKSRLNYNNPKLYIALGRGYEKSGKYVQAAENYKIAGYMMPHEFYPHYVLANMYYKIQKYTLALEEAETVINKPVKIESPAVFQMKNKMEQLRNKIQTRIYK